MARDEPTDRPTHSHLVRGSRSDALRFRPVTTRVGFLGTGLIARFHAGMLASSGEDFVPAAGLRPRRRAGRRLRRRLRLHRPSTPRRRCSTAATPSTSPPGPPSTSGWSARAAERGIHVFCEKPLAVDADGAEAMADVPSSRPASSPRWGSSCAGRRPSGSLGRCSPTRPPGGRWPWCSATTSSSRSEGTTARPGGPTASKAGAGTLIEHSIHDLDILQHMLGPAATVDCRTVGLPRHRRHRGRRRRHPRIHLGRHRVARSRCGTTSTSDRACATSRCSANGRGSTWRATGSARCATGSPATPTRPCSRATAVPAEARRRGARARQPRRLVPAGRSPTDALAWPSPRDAVRAHELADACYASAAAGGTPVAV